MNERRHGVKGRLKEVGGVIVAATRCYIADNAPRQAAAVAFYAVVAAAPLLIIATGIAGIFFGREVASLQAQEFLGRYTTPQAQSFLVEIVSNWRDVGSGILATIIGLATLLYGAYRVFDALQDSLNLIWNVRPTSGGGWKRWVVKRLVPFLMVLGIGLLLIVSLVVSTLVSALSSLLAGWVSTPVQLWNVLDLVVSLGMLTLLFAMIFRVLPDVKIRWSDVWFGAGLTAVLFTIGKRIIAAYLGQASVVSVFGAAGSLVVLLFWVYYSAQILFFGAELTQVWAERYGGEIEPDDDAYRIRITERDRKTGSASKHAPHPDDEKAPDAANDEEAPEEGA